MYDLVWHNYSVQYEPKNSFTWNLSMNIYFCKYAKYDTLYIIIMDFNNWFLKAVDVRLKC